MPDSGLLANCSFCAPTCGSSSSNYHCTGYKGKCPEPYTREEVLAEKFAGLLKGISFSEEVLGWVRRALGESHRDERLFHEEAVAKLQREHRRLQDRIDAMYEDKLDGRIGNEFFDTKAAEMRGEQARLIRDLEAHQDANRNYMEEGVQLLELDTGRRSCSKVSRQAKNGSSWISYSRTARGKAAS